MWRRWLTDGATACRARAGDIAARAAAAARGWAARAAGRRWLTDGAAALLAHDRGARAAAAALGVVASIFIAAWAPFASFDRYTADVRLSLLAPPMAPREDIVFVAVTDETLDRFPFREPINRSFLASVARELDKRGARVIALDILLDKPTVEADDGALEEVLAGAHAPIVLVDSPGGPEGEGCQRGARAPRPGGPAVLARFRRHARLGDGRLCADRHDGVARSLRAGSGGRTTDSFPEVIAAAAGAAPRPVGPGIRFGLGPRGRLPFPVYPAHLVERLPPDWIAGRIAVVGAIAPSADLHVTPLRFASIAWPSSVQTALLPEDTLPGSIVHAYAVAQRLDGLEAPRLRAWREAALAALAGLLGALIGGTDRAWWLKSAMLTGALAAYVTAALGLSLAGGPLLGLSAFSIALTMAGGLAIAVGEHRQRRRTLFVRRAFEHYLAPDVVGELVRDPAKLSLAAREREISVLFSDIEGFTRFVDQSDQAVVADVVNEYLDRMIAVVLAHKGAVDKIVGDSVHALFSAPLEDPEHRVNAVRCALAIEEAAREHRLAVAARGVALGRTRIGVHAGRALVGNFGGSRRFDYTAHGSTINIAARLEAANKVFGTASCVSEAARAEAPGLAYRTIGDVLLRGFDRPIRVLEPVAGAAVARAQRYEAALALLATSPDQAAAALQALALEGPPDPLVRFQLERIRSGRWGAPITA